MINDSIHTVVQTAGALQRKVEVLELNNAWKTVQFKDLNIDDIFRLFEPDGHPVVQTVGDKQFVAWRCETLPMLVNGVLRVNCVPFDLPTF